MRDFIKNGGIELGVIGKLIIMEIGKS